MQGYEVEMEVVRKKMVPTSNAFYSLVRTHLLVPVFIHKSSQLHEFLVSSEISILLRPMVSIGIFGSGRHFVFEICNMTILPTIARFSTLIAT